MEITVKTTKTLEIPFATIERDSGGYPTYEIYYETPLGKIDGFYVYESSLGYGYGAIKKADDLQEKLQKQLDGERKKLVDPKEFFAYWEYIANKLLKEMAGKIQKD